MTAPVTLLPWSGNVFEAMAEWIFAHAGSPCTDLTRFVILLPDASGSRQMRQALQQHAGGAFLAPAIGTLKQWIDENCPSARDEENRHLRELLFRDILAEHRGLFDSADPARLASELLGLFDQLSLRHQRLPDDEAELRQRLGAAYGVPEDNLQLGFEASVVHHLWQAWRKIEDQADIDDPAVAYAARLRDSIEGVCRDRQFLFVPPPTLHGAEIDWVRRMLELGRLHLFLSGGCEHTDLHPDQVNRGLLRDIGLTPPTPIPGNTVDKVLDCVYAPEPWLTDRARELRQTLPESPLAGRIRILGYDKAEDEAHGITSTIVSALMRGPRRIALVTDDRRLARRIRALLERHDIWLDDAAGWALSTSSAASLVESWLGAIEEDFLYPALLDVLKSPFLLGDEIDSPVRAAVFRIEQDIVHHENIGSSLARYRHAAKTRLQRLGWNEDTARHVFELLDRLQLACEPLRPLVRHGRHPASRFVHCLLDSLERLGVAQALYNDPAGMQVLELLRELANAVTGSEIELDWPGFRRWLGSALESEVFHPAQQGSRVRLLTPEQAQAQKFDTLIIAAADDAHLPGGGPRHCFLNDRVRYALGLPVWRDRLRARYYLFRQLLQAAEEICITYSHAEDEEAIPSRWIGLLQAFHRLAWKDDLTTRIDATAMKPATELRASSPPRPVLPDGLFPNHLTATAHQNLITCPYRFAVFDCMRLKAPEEIREALQKSDYGNRVHLCLEAFFEDKPGLPGPFGRPLSDATRAEAIECLQHIAEAVFRRDLETDFMHRGWLRRWQDKIPSCINWFISQTGWRHVASEKPYEMDFHGLLKLKGKIDYLGRDADGNGVILDFKTGFIPAKKDVVGGEAVQLQTYALLAGGHNHLGYLALDEKPVRLKCHLDPEQAEDQATEIDQRLREVLEAIRDGTGLPAWGEEQACRHCDADVLCRRDFWPA